jgi:hypothetical protein
MLSAGNKSASSVDPVSVANKAYQAYVEKLARSSSRSSLTAFTH